MYIDPLRALSVSFLLVSKAHCVIYWWLFKECLSAMDCWQYVARHTHWFMYEDHLFASCVVLCLLKCEKIEVVGEWQVYKWVTFQSASFVTAMLISSTSLLCYSHNRSLAIGYSWIIRACWFFLWVFVNVFLVSRWHRALVNQIWPSWGWSKSRALDEVTSSVPGLSEPFTRSIFF